MRGLFCVAFWIFSSTIKAGLGTGLACTRVTGYCASQTDVPGCIEQKMRQCYISRDRMAPPSNFFFKRMSSSETTLDTEIGYIINISSEALQMSRKEMEGNSDTEVSLFVYVLNETFFRASDSSDIKKRNDPNESPPVLLGHSVLGVWLGWKEVHSLSQPVQLRFTNTSQSGNGICVYWHFDENGTGDWSTDGCTTTTDRGHFVCSCNHLSFFAVLVIPEIPEASDIVLLGYCKD